MPNVRHHLTARSDVQVHAVVGQSSGSHLFLDQDLRMTVSKGHGAFSSGEQMLPPDKDDFAPRLFNVCELPFGNKLLLLWVNGLLWDKGRLQVWHGVF